MAGSISAFILTLNSEKYLEQIVVRLSRVCDEVLIVDSGSDDSTKVIAEKYDCVFLTRAFDNFRDQRIFATGACRNDLVLMVDSDEIPDDALIDALEELKSRPHLPDAFRIRREWYVLGKKIHAVYPVVSPDYPVRLFNRTVAGFKNSNIVHEEPGGYQTIDVLGGVLEHHTFETRLEIRGKLERYAGLSAQVLIAKKKNTGRMQQWLSAIAAFIKWYFAKGGWKDGVLGIALAKFAFDYTFLKYRIARARLKKK